MLFHYPCCVLRSTCTVQYDEEEEERGGQLAGMIASQKERRRQEEDDQMFPDEVGWLCWEGRVLLAVGLRFGEWIDSCCPGGQVKFCCAAPRPGLQMAPGFG